MPNFCPNCGTALKYPEAEICPACGVRIRDSPVMEKKKTVDPAMVLALAACIMSIIALACVIFFISFLSFSPQEGVPATHAVSEATFSQFTNPGFETGTLSGWTAGKTTFILGDRSHNGTYSCHLDMSGTPATDYLSQSLDLTGAHEISFWGTGESNTWPFSLYIDGNLVQTPNAVSNTWSRYTVPVAGYTGIHTFTLKWNGGPGIYGADVDDFAVS